MNREVGESNPPRQQVIPDYIQRMVAATNGRMYVPLIDRLREYPIPRFPVPADRGRRFLEIGCGWGRWLVSAARAGFTPVGIDIKLEAAQAARAVLQSEGIRGYVAVADLRRLPFASGAFDTIWSYSVIQHVHRDWARACLHEIHRCLATGGQSVLEFPTSHGLRNRIVSRRSAPLENDPTSWCVRYYSSAELRNLIEPLFGNFDYWSHCYFGIGIQPVDLKFVPSRYAPMIITSLMLSKLSKYVPGLRDLSDSIYVRALKQADGPVAAESAPWPRTDGHFDWVQILRCPLTSRPLRKSDSGDELITDDGSVGYPVTDGIPVLLAEQAIRH